MHQSIVFVGPGLIPSPPLPLPRPSPRRPGCSPSPTTSCAALRTSWLALRWPLPAPDSGTCCGAPPLPAPHLLHADLGLRLREQTLRLSRGSRGCVRPRVPIWGIVFFLAGGMWSRKDVRQWRACQLLRRKECTVHCNLLFLVVATILVCGCCLFLFCPTRER